MISLFSCATTGMGKFKGMPIVNPESLDTLGMCSNLISTDQIPTNKNGSKKLSLNVSTFGLDGVNFNDGEADEIGRCFWVNMHPDQNMITLMKGNLQFRLKAVYCKDPDCEKESPEFVEGGRILYEYDVRGEITIGYFAQNAEQMNLRLNPERLVVKGYLDPQYEEEDDRKRVVLIAAVGETIQAISHYFCMNKKHDPFRLKSRDPCW